MTFLTLTNSDKAEGSENAERRTVAFEFLADTPLYDTTIS